MTSLLELAERWAASSRVLVLEDDPDMTKVLESMLSQFDCEAVMTATVAESIAAAKAERFDLVFVDLYLPDGSGVDLIRFIKFDRPATPIVVMTGVPDGDLLSQAMSCGVVALLRKPYDTTFAQIRDTLAMFKVKMRSRVPPVSLPAMAAA